MSGTKDEAPTLAGDEASVKTTPISKQKELSMSNFTEVTVTRTITVPFHGANLHVVEQDGQPYTPMKPIVDGMGLDWKSQHRKVATNQARWAIVNLTIPSTMADSTTVEPELHGQDDHAGQRRSMTCIPVRKVAAWLTTIEPGKIKNADVRARVIQYQNECDDALWQYWNEGAAFNPRAFSGNPGDLLTQEEGDTLRDLMQGAARRLSADGKVQGKFMMQGWAKLKSHFKVTYRKIPRSEFSAAVSIVTRHTVEWEVLDAPAPTVPAPARSRTPRSFKGEPLPLPTVILEPARAMLDAAVWRITGQVREQVADWAARQVAYSCRLDLADDLQRRAESAINELTLEDFLTCSEVRSAAVLLNLAETMVFSATQQAQRLRKTLATHFPQQPLPWESASAQP